MSGIRSWTQVQINQLTVLIMGMKSLTLNCLLVQMHQEENALVSCRTFHWNTSAHSFHLPDAFSEGTSKSEIESEEGEAIESGSLSASKIPIGS